MKFGEVIVTLLEDAKFYLRQINESVYTRPIRLLFNASVGHHTQHIIESLQCLVAQAPQGVINYNERVYDNEIAQDPYYAIEVIDHLIVALKTLDEKTTVSILSAYNQNGQPTASNIERELLYNTEHINHHFSLIKIALSMEAPYIQLPSHFGAASLIPKSAQAS